MRMTRKLVCKFLSRTREGRERLNAEIRFVGTSLLMLEHRCFATSMLYLFNAT